MNNILGYFSQNISIPEQIHALSRKKVVIVFDV